MTLKCIGSDKSKKLAYLAVLKSADGIVSTSHKGWIEIDDSFKRKDGEIWETEAFKSASTRESNWTNEDGEERTSSWLVLK
jgi:hypothetical protein